MPLRKKLEIVLGKAAPKLARKRGGFRQKLLSPTETILLLPQRCPCGGVHFENAESFYTHQILELPQADVHVEHLVLHRARCVACGKLVKSALPSEKKTGYGPCLSAMVVELAGCHGDSRRAVQDFLFSVLGVSIRQGAIQKIVVRGAEALQPWYEEITERAQSGAVNHINETSWKTGKKLKWLWVMGTERLLHFPVIWRKCSFDTRTREGEEFIERLLSFRQTCRLQGKRTYPCMVEAFEHYSSGSKPVVLFADARDARHRVDSARSVLSQTLHIYCSGSSLGSPLPGLFFVVFRL